MEKTKKNRVKYWEFEELEEKESYQREKINTRNYLDFVDEDEHLETEE